MALMREALVCVTHLILTHHYWARALDEGCQVDVAFLDVSKAFYRVPSSYSLVRNFIQGLTLNTALWYGPCIRIKTLTSISIVFITKSFKEFRDKPLIYCEI